MSHVHWDFYPEVDEVVFLSETAQRLAIAEGFVTEKHSLSIPNGIELSIHAPPSAEQQRAARRALGIEEDALVFLMPSTLSHQKGVFSVIRWFKMIQNPLKDLKPALILAGIVHPSMKKEERERLKREIHHDSILALGGVPVSSMPSLFAAADICLHPSVNEGFGLAIVEAMATALPVVAIDSGAVPEIIDSGINGILLVDRSDDEKAASVLIELARDPSLRHRLGDAARMTALRFTRQKALEAWSRYLSSRSAQGRAC
jgi:glycosyltransferase involved in cell wall biosynthesis